MAFKFTPPDYIIGIIGLQIITHYLPPLLQIVPSPYIYFGVIPFLYGCYLNFIWVPRAFKKEGTTIDPYEKPKALVTYGPFAYSRNPTYLGMTLMLIGIALLFGSLVCFVFPFLFVLLTDMFVVPQEEKNLEVSFGKKYVDYRKKVRRWI